MSKEKPRRTDGDRCALDCPHLDLPHMGAYSCEHQGYNQLDWQYMAHTKRLQRVGLVPLRRMPCLNDTDGEV